MNSHRLADVLVQHRLQTAFVEVGNAVLELLTDVRILFDPLDADTCVRKRQRKGKSHEPEADHGRSVDSNLAPFPQFERRHDIEDRPFLVDDDDMMVLVFGILTPTEFFMQVTQHRRRARRVGDDQRIGTHNLRERSIQPEALHDRPPNVTIGHDTVDFIRLRRDDNDDPGRRTRCFAVFHRHHRLFDRGRRFENDRCNSVFHCAVGVRRRSG